VTDRPPEPTPSTTVMFTDMVDSTARAVELGDRGWASLLARHNEVVRDHVRRHDGTVMDNAGDGFFVIFGAPATALACATAVVEGLDELGVAIRVGLHTGDCLVVDDKCTGLAIHIGARLAAIAEPGEILVSEAVRRGAGPTFSFTARGERELRGVPGSWALFAVAR
jgi:class 3 adenylate cyclase